MQIRLTDSAANCGQMELDVTRRIAA